MKYPFTAITGIAGRTTDRTGPAGEPERPGELLRGPDWPGEPGRLGELLIGPAPPGEPERPGTL